MPEQNTIPTHVVAYQFDCDSTVYSDRAASFKTGRFSPPWMLNTISLEVDRSHLAKFLRDARRAGKKPMHITRFTKP